MDYNWRLLSTETDDNYETTPYIDVDWFEYDAFAHNDTSADDSSSQRMLYLDM